MHETMINYNSKMKKTTKTKEIIAENLRYLMNINGHSESYLHNKTGLSQSTIGRTLTGQTSTTADTIDLLASFYRLQPSQFITDLVETGKLNNNVTNKDPNNGIISKHPLDDYKEMFNKLNDSDKDFTLDLLEALKRRSNLSR